MYRKKAGGKKRSIFLLGFWEDFLYLTGPELTLPNGRVNKQKLLVNLKKGGLFFVKLLEEINKVKAEHVGKIVLLKVGAFYVSLGIDAYILHEILGLKLGDISNVKRVGVPVGSIEKYIDLMQSYDIPYVVVNNGKIVALSNGKFEFVIKTERIDSLIELFHVKDTIIKLMYEILSRNLGEII